MEEEYGKLYQIWLGDEAPASQQGKLCRAVRLYVFAAEWEIQDQPIPA